MEEDFVTLLLADGPVSALVSNRINWVLAPQGQGNPYIVMTVISGPRDYTYSSQDTLITKRVQIDCYGLSYKSAKDVSRAVANKLSAFKGTQGATRFDGCFIDNERDTFDPDPSTSKLYRVELDVMVNYRGA